MKRRVLGFILLLVIVISIPVYGSDVLEATLTNIKLKLNNNEVELENANGEDINIISINGTTYVPVRAMGNALNLDVNWNATDNCIEYTTKDKAEETTQKKVVKTSEKEWLVEGLFKLTINRVYLTREKQPFTDELGDEVLAVEYTYENIGVEKYIMELYMQPSSVVDEKRVLAENAVVFFNDTHGPKEASIGTICSKATEYYTLENASSTVTVNFEETINRKTYQHSFILNVEK